MNYEVLATDLQEVYRFNSKDENCLNVVVSPNNNDDFKPLFPGSYATRVGCGCCGDEYNP